VKSNFFSGNCIFSSFKLFPSSKIDFWPLQTMDFGQKKFLREIDLFDFTSFFFGLDFFKFSCSLAVTDLVEANKTFT